MRTEGKTEEKGGEKEPTGEESCREEVEQGSIQTNDIKENGRKGDRGRMMEVLEESRDKGHGNCGGVGGL